MASKIADAWKVLPHGPIVPLSENLWCVEGSLPNMSLKRVMTIARRSDGKLVLHSAIAMSEEQMRELEALGEPACLVVPNRGHRLDAPAYKKRYPTLKVYAPSGGRQAIGAVVGVDGAYEDFPADDAVRLTMLHGVKEQEGAMIVTSKDGTSVILNDSVFNMDRKRDPLGFLFTTIFGSAPGPRVSRLAKLVYIQDQKALRRDLEGFAAIPDLVRVIVAHEKVAKGSDAASALRQAATYLH